MASLHPTPRQLAITRAQGIKLLKGGSIALKHTHIDHPDGEHTWLTATQHKRLSGAKGKGSGARLRFSQAQIRHHIKGGGFWGNLWSGIKNVANKVKDGAVWVYDHGGKQVLKPVLQAGVTAAQAAATAAAGRLGESGQKVVGTIAGKAGDWARDKIAGMGVGRKGRGMKGGSTYYPDGSLKTVGVSTKIIPPRQSLQEEMISAMNSSRAVRGLGAGGAGLTLPGHKSGGGPFLPGSTGHGLYGPGTSGGSLLPPPVKGKAYSMLS